MPVAPELTPVTSKPAGWQPECSSKPVLILQPPHKRASQPAKPKQAAHSASSTGAASVTAPPSASLQPAGRGSRPKAPPARHRPHAAQHSASPSLRQSEALLAQLSQQEADLGVPVLVPPWPVPSPAAAESHASHAKSAQPTWPMSSPAAAGSHTSHAQPTTSAPPETPATPQAVLAAEHKQLRPGVPPWPVSSAVAAGSHASHAQPTTPQPALAAQQEQLRPGVLAADSSSEEDAQGSTVTPEAARAAAEWSVSHSYVLRACSYCSFSSLPPRSATCDLLTSP